VEPQIIAINRPNSQNSQSLLSRTPIHRESRPTTNPSSVLHLLPSVLSPLPSGLFSIMQNKPNLKNTKTNPTLYPKKVYKDYPLPANKKNKPKTNPIPSSFVPHPSSLAFTLHPRPNKSASSLPPAIKTPIPTTSGFRNFALCFLTFDFSLASDQLCAKTQRNHHLIMQNKPNPKNTKTNPTPYPKKTYEDFPLPAPQKNKPNSNPIPPPKSKKQTQSKPIQTQSPPPPNSPYPPIAQIRNPPPDPISLMSLNNKAGPRPRARTHLKCPRKWAQKMMAADHLFSSILQKFNTVAGLNNIGLTYNFAKVQVQYTIADVKQAIRNIRRGKMPFESRIHEYSSEAVSRRLWIFVRYAAKPRAISSQHFRRGRENRERFEGSLRRMRRWGDSSDALGTWRSIVPNRTDGIGS